MSAGKTVFFYTRVRPYPTGSGAQVRVFTNIRAYKDIGYDVVLVKFNATREQPLIEIPGLDVLILNITLTESVHHPWVHLFYILGFPFTAVLDFLYPARRDVQREMLRLTQQTPVAIHHFEYLDMASAVIGMPQGRFVWSNHDHDSERFLRVRKMRKDKFGKKSALVETLKLKRIRKAEFRVAQACGLVLAIAQHEADDFRRLWKADHIHLLPMSWPDEKPVLRTREWMAGGKLRLFHLGSLNSMVPYSSMKFILEEVFPLISGDVRDNIEFWVAGEISTGEYCQEILKIGLQVPQIKFLGFVEDLVPLFAEVDLQLVGSSFASGLRTRIIESFARGLPVLSTQVAAEGILGLEHGRNILLATQAEEYARQIVQIARSPGILQTLALHARNSYQANYSRQKEAETLHHLLLRYVP